MYAHKSLGQYIKEKGYSRAFVSHYLLPMCAAVWSVPNAQVCTCWLSNSDCIPCQEADWLGVPCPATCKSGPVFSHVGGQAC
jgi:hypothetical protein